MDFTAWLKTQTKCDDEVGDFARAVAVDFDWPPITKLSEGYQHLDRCTVDDIAVATTLDGLRAAWRAWTWESRSAVDRLAELASA